MQPGARRKCISPCSSFCSSLPLSSAVIAAAFTSPRWHSMNVVRGLQRSQSQTLRLLSSSSSPTSQPPAHHDIPSFLQYVYTANLSPTSTVFSGTLYEYTVLRALATRLPPPLTLNRSGGRDDYGIDLFGSWSPHAHLQGADQHSSTSAEAINPTTIIPLMIQCKAVVSTGPNIIRELEGALTNRSANTMGILASTADATPGIRRHISISARALGFIKVTALEYTIPKKPKSGEVVRLTGGGGLLQQFVWNVKANEMLRDFGVTARYVPPKVVVEENGKEGGKGEQDGLKRRVVRRKGDVMQQEIALTYKGLPLPVVDTREQLL